MPQWCTQSQIYPVSFRSAVHLLHFYNIDLFIPVYKFSETLALYYIIQVKLFKTKKNIYTKKCMLHTLCELNLLVWNCNQYNSLTVVLISPQPDPTEKTIERSPFFVRRGGHCCHRDLIGRTNFEFFFFEWLAKIQSLVAVACFFPGRAKDLSAPRYVTEDPQNFNFFEAQRHVDFHVT